MSLLSVLGSKPDVLRGSRLVIETGIGCQESKKRGRFAVCRFGVYSAFLYNMAASRAFEKLNSEFH